MTEFLNFISENNEFLPDQPLPPPPPARAAGPLLPQPELPELPQPELPRPELPQPELPQPEGPVLPQPDGDGAKPATNAEGWKAAQRLARKTSKKKR